MFNIKRATLSAIAGAALGVLALAVPAQATPVSTNTWYTFGFNTTGTFAYAPPFQLGVNPAAFDPGAAPWTFNLAAAGSITLVDLEISGDEFEVFDFGSSIGTTSASVANASNVGPDITAALNDPNYSQVTFALGAGAHEITILFLGSIEFGDGAFIVNGRTAAAPEPASLALLGLGFAGIGFIRRRKA